ncbi:MAG: beta-ketoacyl-[acyl-carrier-protein] synthase family protein [Bdellovibrionales bacterium]|nr:beta-ketoacyl-[acyl-carrier-protein] synthase family protein [Bdellovibrionales bacterium]
MKKNSTIVSITGMGIISPAGQGIEPLWNACLQKQSLIENGLGTVKHDDIHAAQNSLTHSPWLKQAVDPKNKSLIMALYAITQALDEAEWEEFTPHDVIIIGTTTGQISIWEDELLSYTTGVSPAASGHAALCKQSLSSLSDDLKNILNFPGRIIILASACSASTQAMILAHDMLISGRANRCLAGGVEELGKLTINGFSSLKLLNNSPCKPFDQNRMGINLSEGAAFYSFEISPNRRSLAHFMGGASVLDSYHMTSPNPEGMGLQKAMLNTLANCRVKPADISFVHAHGTGSFHNDQAEAFALAQVFPNRPHVVSSKGVHGHALGASGALELGICLQVLNQSNIPPVTGLEIPDEKFSINLPTSVRHVSVGYLMKTTLGFGGVNSAFILKAENNA